MILDRHDYVLAESVPTAEALIVPNLLRNRHYSIAKLRPLLSPLDVADRSFLRAIKHRHANPVYRLRPISRAEGRRIRELDLSGIFAFKTFDRVGQRPGTLADLIGGVDFFDNGASGLERHFQEVLDGTNGTTLLTLSGLGETLREENTEPAVDGRPLQLTIDRGLQRDVQHDLDQQLSSAVAASAVLLRPAGAVTALVDLGKGAHDGRVSAVDRAFEPGSAFDPITIAAAIDEGFVTSTESFLLPDIGSDGTLGDSVAGAGRSLSAARILAEPNDLGTILIGLRLGAKRFDRWVGTFGFGASTGLEMPGEHRGEVPELVPSAPAVMGVAPIGRGESVTLLQLARAFATFANDGREPVPYLIARFGHHIHPAPAARQVVSERTADIVLRSLASGIGGEVPAIEMSTGTFSPSNSTAAFVGFVPPEDPRFVLALYVHSLSGEALSSLRSVFRKISVSLAE